MLTLLLGIGMHNSLCNMVTFRLVSDLEVECLRGTVCIMIIAGYLTIRDKDSTII